MSTIIVYSFVLSIFQDLKMAAGLRGIATVELLKELQRRMACAEGEEKRTIFFGPPGNKKQYNNCTLRTVLIYSLFFKFIKRGG